jgi:mRNA deadenylase 3'-5' endonuclease subunit Ccr4
VNRPWQYMVDRDVNSNEKSAKISKVENEIVKKEFKKIIKLCSYNLLAPDLLESNSNLYAHIKPTYLDWDYRKTLLIKQFHRLNSDVI